MKNHIQVEEQELPPLFPSHAEPVNVLRINQGIGMGASDRTPQSLLVKGPSKFCISTILLNKCDSTHPFE